jgi:hypothetical protein
MKTLDKYLQNLHIEGNKVFSYSTHVATIDREHGQLLVHGYWSMTTSKHINYVANEYGLKKVEAKKEEDNSILKSVALVASLGSIFCDNQKDKNDWAKRMMQAGLTGISFPEDWDTLTEDEKEKRLNGALAQL